VYVLFFVIKKIQQESPWCFHGEKVWWLIMNTNSSYDFSFGCNQPPVFFSHTKPAPAPVSQQYFLSQQISTSRQPQPAEQSVLFSLCLQRQGEQI